MNWWPTFNMSQVTRFLLWCEAALGVHRRCIYTKTMLDYHIEARQKWPPIYRRHFHIYFWMKILILPKFDSMGPVNNKQTLF